MNLPIEPALLYQAYPPTVIRDIVYGWSRGAVGNALIEIGILEALIATLVAHPCDAEVQTMGFRALACICEGDDSKAAIRKSRAAKSGALESAVEALQGEVPEEEEEGQLLDEPAEVVAGENHLEVEVP